MQRRASAGQMPLLFHSSTFTQVSLGHGRCGGQLQFLSKILQYTKRGSDSDISDGNLPQGEATWQRNCKKKGLCQKKLVKGSFYAGPWTRDQATSAYILHQWQK